MRFTFFLETSYVSVILGSFDVIVIFSLFFVCVYLISDGHICNLRTFHLFLYFNVSFWFVIVLLC